MPGGNSPRAKGGAGITRVVGLLITKTTPFHCIDAVGHLSPAKCATRGLA